ncbi:Peroxidase 52 [Raphanus sativus]|nr:Peroxidase 52 [Raphanus sativus]
MASHQLTAFLVLVVTLLLQGDKNTFVGAQLSANFYSATCPTFPLIVRTAVSTSILAEPRIGASILRLFYLDCFVNGCDGSILLDDTSTFTGEQNATSNHNSARGFNVIDDIKSRLERQCPGVVSCADILATAARDSVVTLGGPSWNVLLGRRDSITASQAAADSSIPLPTSSLSELITSFSNAGFTTREMVALSGAHTIGQAQCRNFPSEDLRRHKH